MSLIALLRHGATQWNADRRLQGRRDIALSDAGRAMVRGWCLPEEWLSARVIASPLQRCVETAAILREIHDGLRVATTDGRLVEMDWGTWEGQTLAELRGDLGPDMAANERLGLDFRPDGGESPRDVQTRLAPVLAELGAQDEPHLLVVHRGVIRAIYARATGWDMCADPPDKLSRNALQVFRLDTDGRPHVAQLNLRVDDGSGE